MDPFWLVVILGGIGYFAYHVRKATPKRSRRQTRGARPPRPRKVEPDWLVARWELAQQLRGTDSDFFPRWYYDPMTEHQARRLDEHGMGYTRSITKGQASDLIGLREPADPSHLEIMRFFKRPTRGVKETQARHEVAIIFADEANRDAWETRPMDARQRDFFRFFGVKVRASLGHKEAEALSDETYRQASASGDPRARQWDIYEQILEELDNPDFREAYDLRKPRPSAVRKAIEGLVASGTPWEDLDADAVADRLTHSE